MKRFNSLAMFALVALASSTALAQDHELPPGRIVLEEQETYSASVTPRALTVAQLRQQIAMEKSRQRRARMEYNAWRGHHPLRPTASDMPMMRSNYAYPQARFTFVPVYVR
ncbi:hypothetical protein Poly24_24670 [Rosistilla carotiformis]|uniref:DUF4148 domain-containing protein n=1 Tax=Rosistilla carotiformis TaxID=2528017 RepID=A0A518JT91_9BACT|nr:hypothetical protein [Rosistilla carotiformis]QDV68754.1 hypothetical protein Poly24_24670 [Rosistilla carotiformis]